MEKQLVNVMGMDIKTSEGVSTVNVVLQNCVYSLCDAYKNKEAVLNIPERLIPLDLNK